MGLATLAVLLPLAASACRYSVRDTGFVDLDLPAWLVRVSGVSEDQRALWEQLGPRRLADTNLRLAPPPGADGGVPASAISPPSGSPALEVVAPDGRALVLATGTELPTGAAAIDAFLDRLAASAFRDTLHDALLQAFAVLVLIEGTDPARTAEARRTAEEAIRGFTPLLGSLPKPVDTPPRVVSLPADQADAEGLLVWGLGFAAGPSAEPRLAVLFGRGRRLGSPLEGPLITRTAIAERLTLIGQDCECDLDRSWFQGPVFPGRWDIARQAAAARRLGFDPENPMIRTEVSRIVLRGPLPGQSRRSAGAAYDALALGYREETVDAAETEPAGGGDSAGETAAVMARAPGPASAASPPELGVVAASPPLLLPWLVPGAAALAVLLLGAVWLVRSRRNRE